MRIAQFTLLGYYNYGQTLQRFALQHTLKKFADSVEVIWRDPMYGWGSIFVTGGKPAGQMVKHTGQRDWEKKLLPREAIRQSRFKDFENLHIETRFNVSYFEELADEYDFVVLGSEQVWHPGFGYPYDYFKFVPYEKKIAYAVSLGVNAIPDDKKEIFRRGVSDFKYLSVREENATQIIRELTGRDSLWVVDPVLLLTLEEWLDVAKKPPWFKEKYSRGYVLTYHLSKLPPPEIKQLADKLDLPVINLMDTENYNHYTVGPAEFIWLFANATLIFTNSFYGTAFSLLFKRPFALNGLRGNNDPRLESLLKLFGLEDRMTALADPLAIDFSRREEVLPVEKAKAFKYLSEALGVEPREKLLGGDK